MKTIFVMILVAGFPYSFETSELSVDDYLNSVIRIVEGSPADDGQFPYAASLYSRADENATSGSLCGASIISTNTLITAAHCVRGRRAFLVVAGAVNRLNGRQIFKWNDDPTIHEEFNPELLNFDIALLWLPEGNRFEFDEYVQPVQLPFMNYSRLEGEVAVVAGWGLHGDNGPDFPLLYYANVSVISNNQCNNFFPDGIVIDSTLCAVSADPNLPFQGACFGDSGGPLVIFKDNQVIQVGIVSFGSLTGCDNEEPNGFIRTSSFYDWIAYNMGWDF